MPRYELTKSLEAKKMNKRSGLPLPEPPVIIPFGSVIDDLKRDRGAIRFTYLFELFEVSESVLDSAIRQVGSAEDEEDAPSSPAAVVPEAEAAAPAAPALAWQQVSTAPVRLLRAKVPGGWLLSTGAAVSFYPDAGHIWDGRSLD